MKNRLESKLEATERELKNTIDEKNKLLNRVLEIEESLNQITEIGLLDFIAINVIKEGE